MNTEYLRNEWVKWLASKKYTHTLTLKPNNPRIEATKLYLAKNLNRFHRDLDRQLLGTRFLNEKNGVLRTKIIAVMEGLPYNGHIHAAVTLADGLHDRFMAVMSAENPRHPWMKSVPGGTVHVEPIFAADGWFEYITKRCAHSDFSDDITILP